MEIIAVLLGIAMAGSALLAALMIVRWAVSGIFWTVSCVLRAYETRQERRRHDAVHEAIAAVFRRHKDMLMVQRAKWVTLNDYGVESRVRWACVIHEFMWSVVLLDERVQVAMAQLSNPPDLGALAATWVFLADKAIGSPDRNAARLGLEEFEREWRGLMERSMQ